MMNTEITTFQKQIRIPFKNLLLICIGVKAIKTIGSLPPTHPRNAKFDFGFIIPTTSWWAKPSRA